MISLKIEEESILILIEELRALKSVTIMPKGSVFDEYMKEDSAQIFPQTTPRNRLSELIYTQTNSDNSCYLHEQTPAN